MGTKLHTIHHVKFVAFLGRAMRLCEAITEMLCSLLTFALLQLYPWLYSRTTNPFIKQLLLYFTFRLSINLITVSLLRLLLSENK
jgi:hypothetical protein